MNIIHKMRLRSNVDTQRSTTEQAKAAYEAYQASVKIAQDNLGDTMVYAPYSGTLRMDDIDMGAFCTSWFYNISYNWLHWSIFVEFSMTEQEYLDFMKIQLAMIPMVQTFN